MFGHGSDGESQYIGVAFGFLSFLVLLLLFDDVRMKGLQSLQIWVNDFHELNRRAIL